MRLTARNVPNIGKSNNESAGGLRFSPVMFGFVAPHKQKTPALQPGFSVKTNQQ
jgi:hypothetical protein